MSVSRQQREAHYLQVLSDCMGSAHHKTTETIISSGPASRCICVSAYFQHIREDKIELC